MITFTPSAIKAAQEAIQSAEEPFIGLRLTAEGGGCSGPNYGLGLEETEEDGDTVLDFDGLKVLVDPASLTLAEGAQVDFVEDDRGPVFVVSNPTRKGKGGGGGCGCGGHG